MPDNWTIIGWQAVTTRWFDCGVSIVCPCGAELVIDADSGERECQCGRTYRLACQLKVKPPVTEPAPGDAAPTAAKETADD